VRSETAIGSGALSIPGAAVELARQIFGTSEQFWLNLQDAFAVHQVRKKYSKELKAITPLAAAAAR
jgi:plasmid maintenance system antidote protein VapI